MKRIFIFLIKIYQTLLSPFKKGTCVFYPTCSEYAKEVILKYGVIKGTHLSLKRIIRCHPWQKNQIDKVN